MDYEEAYEFATQNQHRAVRLIPRELVAREERFLERIKGAKVGPLRKLQMLYELMDELLSAVSKALPCKKGCSSCCHIKVDVHPIEIEYIEKNTKYRRKKQLGPLGEFHGAPCSFLKDGVCAIYSARPFVCRRYMALTPDSFWCHPDRSLSKKFPLLGFSEAGSAYVAIGKEANVGEHVDIRRVFR